jgi:hypothetical protein
VDAKLIPPEVEIRHQNISVVVSKMWAEVRRLEIGSRETSQAHIHTRTMQADPETKTKFQEEARIEKEAHMRK